MGCGNLLKKQAVGKRRACDFWRAIMSSCASLNHVFRTVWNQALGAMVAVAEISRGHVHGSQHVAGTPSHAVDGCCFGLNSLVALVAASFVAIPFVAIDW